MGWRHNIGNGSDIPGEQAGEPISKARGQNQGTKDTMVDSSDDACALAVEEVSLVMQVS